MKHTLTIIFITISSIFNTVFSQTFIQSSDEFLGLDETDVSLVDIDGDGDLDLFINGQDGRGNLESVFYINDGKGKFEQRGNFSGIEPVFNGDVVFADFDGDGDNDALRTGGGLFGSNGDTDLYINDGNGDFEKEIFTQFIDLSLSGVGVADFNNDGSIDIVLSGLDVFSNFPISATYLNNGNGVFSEDIGNGLNLLAFSTVHVSFLDGDNLPDIIQSGVDINGNPGVEVFENIGSGKFAKINNPQLEQIFVSDIASADIDGDGDMDVLMTGFDDMSNPVFKTQLYLNNGNGVLELAPSQPFEVVSGGGIFFADLDNDGNSDLLLTGELMDGSPYTGLYKGDGSAGFVEMQQTNLPDVAYGDNTFGDVDVDGDLDIVLTGTESLSNERFSSVFFNTLITSTRNIKNSKSIQALTLFPNPLSGNSLSLSFSSISNTEMQLTMTDISGVNILNNKLIATKGDNTINLTIPQLAAGTYFVQIESEEAIYTNELIITY